MFDSTYIIRNGLRPARLLLGGSAVLVFTLAALHSAVGQPPPVRPAALPFQAGEESVFRAVSSRFGTMGTGTMKVEGPEQLRGYETVRLSFDFRGRVGPFGVEDRTRSWFVPGEMLSLRYQKRERSPITSRDESVEIFPRESVWRAADDSEGKLGSGLPLDELSFLYFVRSLPFDDTVEKVIERHYHRDRNPVRVRLIRRERITVPAGEFAVLVVEMKVRDGTVFGGEGTLRMYLTDDERRIPVQIDSSFPWVGKVSMRLVSASAPALAKR